MSESVLVCQIFNLIACRIEEIKDYFGSDVPRNLRGNT